MTIEKDQSYFQGPLEVTQDAMVTIDRVGAITAVNGQVEQLFGCGRGELIGRPVDVLVIAAVREVFAHRAIADGLRASEANFRQLIENVDVAFMLTTLDPAEFIYVSPGFIKIFDYDPMRAGEDRQPTLLRTHPDDLADMQRLYWDPIRKGQPAHREFRIVRSEGETRWVGITSRPVRDTDGAIRSSAGTAEDITERKLAEAALRQAHTDAKTANAAKDEFLSRMSHELRTPLNAVLGFAQLLELDELTAAQQDAVQFILHGGRHLLGLIDDVLDITKIETDRLEISMEPVLLAQLVRETIEFIRPLAGSMDVGLHWHPDGGDVRYVQADRRRLRQVLLNLLSNAIKYNKRGGSVDVCCREISGTMSEIEVRDTGRGIAAQDLPRLFTPFERLGAQAIGIEGTGVGLALSQRLMANMGGSLRAESQQGVGSAFIASIATAKALPSPDDAEHAVNPQPAIGQHDQPARLLVYVEDNESNIDLMVSLLRRRTQWRMLVAHNGLAGIDLIDTQLPELVLLDLHLPEMEGIDVLRRLRANPLTDKLRVVIVSADANPHQIQRLLAAGADAYITKPLDVAKILRLLDSAADEPMSRVDRDTARAGG